MKTWNALQELYQIYEAEDLDGANQALGRFADLYASGQIPEYREIVNTIIAWGEEILAYHTMNSSICSKSPRPKCNTSQDLPGEPVEPPSCQRLVASRVHPERRSLLLPVLADAERTY